jgi:ABC-type uncharacterized transport system fused permease/ATPase subunit
LQIQPGSFLFVSAHFAIVRNFSFGYQSISMMQVVTPTGNILVEDLTLKVEQGSNLLITGVPLT